MLLLIAGHKRHKRKFTKVNDVQNNEQFYNGFIEF